jgi:hypothetical protein
MGRFVEVVQLEGPGAPPPLAKVERLVRLVDLLRTLVGAPNRWLVSSDLPGGPSLFIYEERVYRRSLEVGARGDAEALVAGAVESAFGAGELERPLAYAKALR